MINYFNKIEPKIHFNQNGYEHASTTAYWVDQIGHIFSISATAWLETFSRTFLLEYKPGWWGQSKYALIENLYRSYLAINLITTLPIAGIGTLVGTPLRLLAGISKKDFVIRSLTETPSIDKNQNSLSTLSFNTLLMPEFLTLRNKQRSTMTRVNEIVQYLLKRKDDFICLQEVFHTEASEILAESLQKAGYHTISHVAHQSLGLNSGLFMASRGHPLEKIEFYEHPALKIGVDRWARKGTLIATASVNGKKVVLANTHLNGGGEENGVRSYVARAAQILALVHHIEKYIEKRRAEGTTVDGVILCGDTNISPTFYKTESGKKIPVLEKEWFLTNALHQIKETLPLPEDPSKSFGWSSFCIKTKEIFDSLFSKQSVEENIEQFLNAHVTQGGPFPSNLYPHDIKSAKEALAGSTLDLDTSPEVGWGTKIAAQPERVDFITLHSSYKGLKIKKNEILSGQNEHGQALSDHLPVGAVIDFVKVR